MGGQSAVHENCLPETAEKLSTIKIHCGQSAKGPRTVRLCWAEFARGSVSRVAVNKFKGGRSAKKPRTVRDWTEWWGRPDLTYKGCPSHNPPPNRTHHQKALSLSLSSTWGRRQGQGFLAWFPDGPRTSPDSSQDCASCPLGILTNP